MSSHNQRKTNIVPVDISELKNSSGDELSRSWLSQGVDVIQLTGDCYRRLMESPSVSLTEKHAASLKMCELLLKTQKSASKNNSPESQINIALISPST